MKSIKVVDGINHDGLGGLGRVTGCVQQDPEMSHRFPARERQRYQKSSAGVCAMQLLSMHCSKAHGIDAAVFGSENNAWT